MDTTIILSEEDIEKFKLFMQYYKEFSKLIGAGVFEIRPGRAIMNIDKNGVINNIEIIKIVY